MKYNLNQLRSWGLRYIVSDLSGQLWASERIPVRSEQHYGCWRIPDEFFPPKRPDGLYYYVDTNTHSVVCSDEALEKDLQRRTNRYYGYYARENRHVIVPLSDCPFEITWESEPFDLVANGIVPEADMKKWPDPPIF